MAPLEAIDSDGGFRETNVAYALDRAGFLASGRLILQSYLWAEVTGSAIHPRILADIAGALTDAGGGVEVNVADVGTGTGTWALGVAGLSGVRGISKFRVHGFDISDEQFPPSYILPDNVQLSVGDALAQVPDQLHGSFDIVHVAHFAGVRALGEDPSPVLEHAVALLKPGGWIQWDEWARDVEVVGLAPSPHCDAALGVSAKVFPQWLNDLAGYISRHGFVDSVRQDFRPSNTLLPGLTALWFMTAEEVVKIGFEDPTQSMMLRMLMAAHGETKSAGIRAMLRMCPSSVTGKKMSAV
ncbi:S-adenosyl-L-methionine-dependent methyltransferase [Podospora conica]|nr:S-adenosyl-L-methionine-dependent methyltransferase [Schizothecium conicum]